MRKPISISTSRSSSGVVHSVAVCDDGSIWNLEHHTPRPTWVQLPSIPSPVFDQADDAEDKEPTPTPVKTDKKGGK